ncbi:MAG: hypothetical protein ITG02_13830 [Patulibacter sp.]|nr:hypothetical protein [Patulibacter sp.]
MTRGVVDRGIRGPDRAAAWPAACVLALLIGVLVVAGGLGDGRLAPAPAAAADAKPGQRSEARLDDLVGFLQDTQNDDGGYGGSPGAASDPLISAWVGIGLAAAGINPQDQKPPGARSTSVASYLAKQGPARTGGAPPVTTEYARIGMFVNAAGMDPRKFGGRDYVAPLLARQATVPATVGDVGVPPGWFPHADGGTVPGVNDTIFAVFFLTGLQDRSVRPAIQRATDAIIAMQRPDGTWPATRPGDGVNVDMTGAAVQALCAAGRCGEDPVKRAIAYLRQSQQSDGGWQAGDLGGELAGQSNAGTTPWVVQALWAVGEDPAKWKPAGKDPLQFLAGLQRRDGSVMWRASQDMNPTWMTAYAAPAFAGHAWPVPAPPRAAEVKAAKQAKAEKRAAAKRAAARRIEAERTAGNAGEAADGDGATATGGGGRGADLFSRPQPQSLGDTTGGVRDTEREQERQESTKGDDGATGTAAASGVGDDGGVENAPPSPEPPAAESPGVGRLISGQVVEAPRGTEGRQLDDAVAAGLRTAQAGGAATPWAATALGGAIALCMLIGMRLETRPGSRWGR